jgi:hypothetical protein
MGNADANVMLAPAFHSCSKPSEFDGVFYDSQPYSLMKSTNARKGAGMKRRPG